MSIEKIIDSSFGFSRKAASYLVNDPAGEASLAAGYGLLGVAPIISVPLLAFGIWHVPYALSMRKKLSNEIKEKGINENTLDKFNKSSWCSHRVTVAYTLGQGKYDEFKGTLYKYPVKHYSKKLVYHVGNKISEDYNKLKNKLRNIVF